MIFSICLNCQKNYNPNDTLLENHKMNRFICNETQYDREALGIFVQQAIKLLNKEQLTIYKDIP